MNAYWNSNQFPFLFGIQFMKQFHEFVLLSVRVVDIREVFSPIMMQAWCALTIC